jgi:hypothetical protein
VGHFQETLVQMGTYLIDQIQQDKKGRALVMMCAEADTQLRIHAYTSNNLWAVVGLRSLGSLLESLGHPQGPVFSAKAESLYKDVRAMLDDERIESPYGPLVPFRSGYTPRPLTLSLCRNIPGGPPPESYFNQLDVNSLEEVEQDYTQNTYANYRYYAEMLSSGLLRPEEGEAIVKMREELGGELLGMTRLWDRIDDWPADNYARYYLENDRLDKYLLLYYAHVLYHGNLHTGVYYEQVSAGGRVVAGDCVPSLMTAPLMTAWMFCFQPVQSDAVYLLRGLPPDWFSPDRQPDSKPVAARGLCSTAGEISIRIDPSLSQIHIEMDTDKPWKDAEVYIDLHIDSPPEPDKLDCQGAFMEKTSRPGRYRLYMQEKHVEITIVRRSS